MDKKQQWHIWYFVVAALAIVVLQQMWAWNQQVEVIPYSQFLNDLKAEKIEEVRWPRLFGQFFRFDKWSLCRG